GQVNAFEGPVRDLKLRTVLDRAAGKIAGRFERQPLVEAALRVTMGLAYRSLKELEKSLEQDSAALAIYQRELGPTAAETANAMISVGAALYQTGRIAEAEPLIRQ